MKRCKLFAIAFVLFTACTKQNNSTVNLDITKTKTPETLNSGNVIISQVTCFGPNLCYHFSNFKVGQIAEHEFEIRALGTYPKYETACADAVFYVDTTVTINTSSKGRYLLHFMNNNLLFKTDTVQVN